jgi:hypothetical protein
MEMHLDEELFAARFQPSPVVERAALSDSALLAISLL